MLRHIDVSADTAVDFPMEELFSARMMSLRAYITQALRDNIEQSHHQSLQILWLLKVETTRDNSTDRIAGWKTGQRKISIISK